MLPLSHAEGPTALERRLEAALDKRRVQNRLRQRRCLQSAQGARVRVDGRSVLAFCSNDYLGLASHPQVSEAFQRAAARYGAGSGASHLISGHSEEHHQLEAELAAFTGRERALLVSTGYMANFGLLNALTDEQSVIFADQLDHASLLDGGFVSKGQLRKFAHNDLDDLRHQLSLHPQASHKLIAVDGVYSMDGDLAPLPEMARLAAAHDATLMVDDAHGFGWLGDRGAGVLEHFSLDQQQVPILMATLGKSLGVFGAFIAGSEALIEALVQLCRPYVYSTALPPAVAAAARASLALLQSEPEHRAALQHNIEHFRRGARERNLPVADSATPIQPVILGGESLTMAVAEGLLEQGFWVGSIRPPTVAAGSCRLRISLSAAHSEADVDALLDALQRSLRQTA